MSLFLFTVFFQAVYKLKQAKIIRILYESKKTKLRKFNYDN